ncbi:hypothetical protein ACPOL_1015 [Acidisarcina polymorpha]|uniref:Uncharacterized protein n=1 Tax=Acidisarcina polymorpha TaxID=2211140 RepID=A0A2Z5FVC4_9BACT|nr:hypothetical protein ACPOL_1015 [Acidisarcina polymorpha]
MAATVDESTPPDMATATVLLTGGVMSSVSGGYWIGVAEESDASF